jgi:hypothetical protein
MDGAPAPTPTAQSNRAATRAEAGRLLALAPVPDGAIPTAQRPAGLDGPALGTPADGSLVDDDRYWIVHEPLATVAAYVRSHRPAGLKQSGSSSSGNVRGATVTSEGIEWSEPDRPYATGLELDEGMAPVAHGASTVIRADGMGIWLDPRPIRDTAKGPRLRVAVAAGCPSSDRGAVAVSNPGSGLNSALLPAGTPTAGLICEYGGGNIKPVFSLGRSTPLRAAAAVALAKEVRRLPLAHTEVVEVSCPMDDGSIDLVALSYPGRPDVDLWAAANGCATVSNGTIVADSSLDLRRWAAPLKIG